MYEGTFPSGITNLNPDANDGAAIGTSGTAWSDLFLASGAVIDFNAGNYTITHSAGVLTLSGTLTVSGGAGAASVTLPATGRLYLDGGGNTYLYEVGADIIGFVGGGTERARITAGGYFKASNGGAYSGATSSWHELIKTEDHADVVVQIQHQGATATNQYGAYIRLAGDPNDATRWFVQCTGNATERATIRSNGGLANYTANDVNLSDVNAKKIKGASADHTDFIESLDGKFKKYAYRDTTEEGQELDGLTAQDLQAIAPELVTEFSDGQLGIYTHRLQERINSVIPKLVKRIKALEARL